MKKIIHNIEQSPITQWAQGETKLNHGPWLSYIGVTNICNSRCKVCAHKTAMRSEQGTMPPEIFDRICSQLPESINKVYLMKQGEPFINKNLENYAAQLRRQRPKMHIATHTNGILLSEKRLGILKDINSLGVSISAISRDIYKKVHGVDKFNLVKENLHSLSEALLKIEKKDRPHVFIDYVSQNANASENREEVIEFFASNFPGLASVDFHWVYNFQGEIDEGHMDIYDRLPYEKFPVCIFPNVAVTFCHDGNVSYCFVEPRENAFLGNIVEQSFEEIWNGAAYTSFRKEMKEHNFAALKEKGFYCHKCAWLWSLQGQTPQQLIKGLWRKDSTAQSPSTFQQLISSSPEELAEEAQAHYLDGNPSQALSVAEFLKATHQSSEAQHIADEIIRHSKDVLNRYANLSLWQEELKKEEGHSSRKCEYHEL
ncbi:radical SAM/SPASM domain-containing protein [Maridesulfovibrio sp.]|uniref:radical SAM protein n=1 Tax=Maridesulfovibrio sp. TaxID=2795000 RepID=UPI003BAA25C3